MKLANTVKVKAIELKPGDRIERYSYEKGAWWIDTIVDMEPHTWSNGKAGFRIYWLKGYDGYKSTLCVRGNVFNRVI